MGGGYAFCNVVDGDAHFWQGYFPGVLYGYFQCGCDGFEYGDIYRNGGYYAYTWCGCDGDGHADG